MFKWNDKRTPLSPKILFCSLNQNWDQWVYRPQLSASWEARSCLSEAEAKCSKFSDVSFSTMQTGKYFGIAGKAFCLYETCLVHCISYNYLKGKKTLSQIRWEPKAVGDVATTLRLVQGWMGWRLPHGSDQPGRKKHEHQLTSSSVAALWWSR